MSDIKTVIGLMSGTSLDGIDAAILKTDGESVIAPGPSLSLPYAPRQRALIKAAVKAALEGRFGAVDIGAGAQEVNDAHIDAVKRLLEKAGLAAADVDLIGFHGQTIFHRPASMANGAPGKTMQIGDGRVLAMASGIDVVSDFRSADVAAGGEGAPLAPIYHGALARNLKRSGPVAVLNLGGVSNVSYIPEDAGFEDIIAFDCGPANGLVDQWVEVKTGEAMDKDGALARQGVVQNDVLRRMLTHPYLKAPPPKSLDRYDFTLDAAQGLSLADGAATLTAFTAACIAAAAQLLPAAPVQWIACGGGRRNPAMMEALNAGLKGMVVSAEDVGWRGDDIEAECFAYLAVRSVRGMPITFPKTTKAPKAMVGGAISHAVMG